MKSSVMFIRWVFLIIIQELIFLIETEMLKQFYNTIRSYNWNVPESNLSIDPGGPDEYRETNSSGVT